MIKELSFKMYFFLNFCIWYHIFNGHFNNTFSAIELNNHCDIKPHISKVIHNFDRRVNCTSRYLINIKCIYLNILKIFLTSLQMEYIQTIQISINNFFFFK